MDYFTCIDDNRLQMRSPNSTLHEWEHQRHRQVTHAVLNSDLQQRLREELKNSREEALQSVPFDQNESFLASLNRKEQNMIQKTANLLQQLRLESTSQMEQAQAQLEQYTQERERQEDQTRRQEEQQKRQDQEVKCIGSNGICLLMNQRSKNKKRRSYAKTWSNK